MLGKYLGYPCSKHFLVSDQFFLMMLFSYSSFSCVLRQGRAPPPGKHPVSCRDLLCTWWYWFQTCRLWTELNVHFFMKIMLHLFLSFYLLCASSKVYTFIKVSLNFIAVSKKGYTAFRGITTQVWCRLSCSFVTKSGCGQVAFQSHLKDKIIGVSPRQGANNLHRL